MFGQQLLQSGHYASVEIQEKLESLAEARQELEKLVFVYVFCFFEQQEQQVECFRMLQRVGSETYAVGSVFGASAVLSRLRTSRKLDVCS